MFRLQTVLLILLIAVVFAGCKIPIGESETPEDRASSQYERLVQAHDEDDPSTALEAAASLGSWNGSKRQMVKLNAIALLAASQLDKQVAVDEYGRGLNGALANFEMESTQSARPDEDEKARMLAEGALRTAQGWAYDNWIGGRSVASRDLFLYLTESYLTHFPDAILVADVLWRKAEYLRMTNNAMEAVPVYEIIEVRDYTGKHKDQARQRIIETWTSASRGTPLPRDIEERTTIPSPHAEWMAIAQRTIDEDPTAPAARERQLRFAEIQLAYKQIDEGYATLRDIMATADDDYSEKAARKLLQHAAEHAASSREFRLIRKELQANKFLWGRRPFRIFLNKLKKQVEGR